MWACTMLGRFVQHGVASGFIYLLSSSALRGVSSLTWPRGVSRGLFSQSSTPDSAELRAGRSNAIAPTAAARSTQRSSNLRFSLTDLSLPQGGCYIDRLRRLDSRFR